MRPGHSFAGPFSRPAKPRAAVVRYGVVRLARRTRLEGVIDMRMLSIGLAAFAASALIAPSPAAAQRHGGMGGGAMTMHQFNGGGFRGEFRGGMGGFRGTFRPGFRGGFRGFRRRPVIIPGWGWGWGWGWGPGWDSGWGWAPPPCRRWWWDGWGWRCVW